MTTLLGLIDADEFAGQMIPMLLGSIAAGGEIPLSSGLDFGGEQRRGTRVWRVPTNQSAAIPYSDRRCPYEARIHFDSLFTAGPAEPETRGLTIQVTDSGLADDLRIVHLRLPSVTPRTDAP
jgi:hypothetical protein